MAREHGYFEQTLERQPRTIANSAKAGSIRENPLRRRRPFFAACEEMAASICSWKFPAAFANRVLPLSYPRFAQPVPVVELVVPGIVVLVGGRICLLETGLRTLLGQSSKTEAGHLHDVAVHAAA